MSQDPYQEMVSTMEALMTKSAKMTELTTKLANSKSADAIRPVIVGTLVFVCWVANSWLTQKLRPL